MQRKIEKVEYVFSKTQEIQEYDMIEMFKMIDGIPKVNLGKHFCINADERTRKLFTNEDI